MPKQRMAGYTPLKGRAHDDDATPLTQDAAPQPVAGAGPEETVAPATAAPAAVAGGAVAGGAAAAAAPAPAEPQGVPEAPEAPAAEAVAPAPVAAASAPSRDAVPYEQRQRMVGYTPFRGAAPQAAAPAEAAVADSSAPVQAEAAPTTSAAPVAGVPYEQRQRMAGYTPLKGGATAAAAQDTSDAAPAATDTPAADAAEAPAAPVGQRMKGYTPLKRRAAAPAASAPAAAGQAAPAEQPVAEAPAATAPAAQQAPEPAAEQGRQAAAEAPAAPKQRMGAGTAAAAAGGAAAAGAAGAAAAHASGRNADAPQGAADTTATTSGQTTDQTPRHAAPSAAAQQSGQPSAAQKPAGPQGTAAKAAAGRKPAGAPAAQPKKKAKDAEPMPLGRKVLWGVLGAVVVGLALVLAARGLRTLEPVQQFIAQYDGHTAQPDSAPTGIPAWLGWQHFLNMFLMVLIIRTGLQIRHEQRPPANFTPRKDSLFSAKGNSPKKYSMTIWMHQALDGLWVLNGLVFVILLFVTGQWMRIVPTDPYVFHHALSAGLQYASLDWPAENGWIHYNALQMIAYTLVVFVAAPLAALTGWRMSSWFPTENKGLNKAFPMEAARKVHFPVMLFFVAFILVHVFLVVFTGLLANLNHMYTSREATDAWGLVVFLVSVAVTAAAWFFLRPQFVAPVAQRFGTVGR